MGLPAGKIRYLLLLNQLKEKGTTVTEIAKLACVTKSTISRALTSFAEDGILYENRIELTPYGEETACRYQERYDLLVEWLTKGKKTTRETAVSDAYAMLAELSDELIGSLTTEVRIKKELHSFLNQAGAGGNSYRSSGSVPSDGTYPVLLTFFRKDIRIERFLSMADSAFRHRGACIVKEASALIRIEAREISHESRLKGLILKGKAEKLFYETRAGWRQAANEACFYYIPAEAFSFQYYEEEERLLGVIKVKFRVSVDEQHMPDSEAILTIETS